MPDPTGTYNDGGLVFGSQVVTIATHTFIAEAFSLKRATNRSASMNEHGVENKQHFTANTPSGELTLQLPDAAAVPPALFANFTATEIGGATITLVISEVGQTQSNNGEAKVTISAYKKLGA